jgi:hypothetical protein
LFVAQQLASQSNLHSSAAAALASLATWNQRSLHLLHARWLAGMLFAPTAEEVTHLAEDEALRLPVQMCGAFFYFDAAQYVVHPQVPLPPPADAEARLQNVYGALRAALEMDARGMLERDPRTGQPWSASRLLETNVPHLKLTVHGFVASVLRDEAGLLPHMRVTCGLTAAEETALRQLAERNKAEAERSKQELPKHREDAKARHQHAAAADVARHGLRRCTLPSCDAQEPHPKLFKLCGRCNAAAYCCKEHQTEDWKRHKREDGCAAAP